MKDKGAHANTLSLTFRPSFDKSNFLGENEKLEKRVCLGGVNNAIEFNRKTMEEKKLKKDLD